VCCILAGAVMSSGLAAAAGPSERVLIRNVRVIDPEGETDYIVVNLLVKGGELDIVTKDIIQSDRADLVVDANNGVLFGQLELGEPPSFLIFDVDPREDPQALLDTKTHARFAMRRGEIVKNTLQAAAEAQPELEENRPSRWFAYTPPPLSLPVSRDRAKRWNYWQGKSVSGVFLGALLLDSLRWLSVDEETEQLVGPLDDSEGGEIRGLRFGAVGTFNFKRPWVYTVFAATNAFDRGFDSDSTDDFSFLDYRLDIPLGKRLALSIGKQKEPISMERIMSLAFEPQQERAAVSDALMPSRNVGLVLNSALAGQRMTFAGGVFNDWFDAGEDFGESGTQLVGRVTALPLKSDDESALLHLGLGVRYTNAGAGLRYRTEPEFANSPDFVDTGVFDADRAMLFNFEVSARRGPVWLAGEYNANRVSAVDLGDPSFSGYHITASWIATGEMRAYNRRSGTLGRVPIAKPVDRGGLGAWELSARWSDIDLSDGAISGGEMQILSLGVNWWPAPWGSMSVNYRNIRLDRFDITGRSDGFMIRLLLMLE
jgi:phosphate-selective porin OprO/OprP